MDHGFRAERLAGAQARPRVNVPGPIGAVTADRMGGIRAVLMALSVLFAATSAGARPWAYRQSG
ncbi:hypothetical protein [Catenuloplanes sp. NPDC020197]|uniref:hypothetical protein n=1 Tax=Catenuloplanes sp. NPDC020197 TaxID=3363958 RepID=UPI0037B5EF4D